MTDQVVPPTAEAPDSAAPSSVEPPDPVIPPSVEALDPAAAWRGLVTAALLGTDRAGSSPPVLPEQVRTIAQEAGAPVHGADPAGLLAAAALVDVALSAGRRPGSAGLAVPVPEAPRDTLPVARTSPPTVARLLAGPAEEREEWVDLLRTRGLLAPPYALPGLLRLAAGDRALRRSLRDVVGPRGVWLAGLDPDLAALAAAWADAPSQDEVDDDGEVTTDDTWRLGDLDARVRWLQDLRAHDPGAGRDAVVGVLAGLPAAERTALLAALGEGLGDEDEALLERALDDRAAGPRRVAADLLARLPRSAFADRARARAAGHLRVARVGLRRHLVVDLPGEAFDAAAVRDGLEEPTPGRTGGAQGQGAQGQGAQRLHRLLVAAPLDTWVPRLAPSPEDLLRFPVADDRADLVHGALAEAAERAGDARWAAALLAVSPRHSHRLAPLLPLPDRARAVVSLLRGTPDDRALARTVLMSLPRPWPTELADAAVGAVRRTPVDAPYGLRATARDLAQLLGRRADPLTALLDPGDDPLLQQAAATLADRRQTIEETTA